MTHWPLMSWQVCEDPQPTLLVAAWPQQEHDGPARVGAGRAAGPAELRLAVVLRLSILRMPCQRPGTLRDVTGVGEGTNVAEAGMAPGGCAFVCPGWGESVAGCGVALASGWRGAGGRVTGLRSRDMASIRRWSVPPV